MNLAIFCATKNEDGVPVRGHKSRGLSIARQAAQMGVNASVFTTDDEKDWDSLASLFDIVIGDGYFGAEFQRVMHESRKKNGLLVSLNDLEPGIDFPDIHWCPGVAKGRLSGLTDVLSGPGYAVVDQKYWNDPFKVIESHNNPKDGDEVAFISGSGDASIALDRAMSICKRERLNLRVIDDFHDMREFTEYKMIFVPASVTMWEAAVLEIPFLAFQTANNQYANMVMVATLGLNFVTGRYGLSRYEASMNYWASALKITMRPLDIILEEIFSRVRQ